METYEILERALALIEDERDWCQGQQESPSGERCAGGALIAVLEAPVPFVRQAAEALGSLAAKRLGVPTEDREDAIVNFNDTHFHAEVVALFQEAIRNEKAKAGVPVEVPETQEVPA